MRFIAGVQFGREKAVFTPNPPLIPIIPSQKEIVAKSHPAVRRLDKEQSELIAAQAPAKKSTGPKRVVGKVTRKKSPQRDAIEQDVKFQVLVFYASLGGQTEARAKGFTKKLAEMKFEGAKYTFLDPQIHDLAESDYDEFFLNLPKAANGINVKYFYILLLPTYNIDSMTDAFIEHLQETHNDFRIDTAPLSPLLGFSVFGFGDKEGWPTEAEGYCSQALDVDRWMAKLTARKRAFPLGMGDSKVDAEQRLDEWREGIQDVLENLGNTGNLGDGVVGSGNADESDVEDASADEEEIYDGEGVQIKKTKGSDMTDLEDIGRIMKSGRSEDEPENASSGPLAVDFTTYSKNKKEPAPTAAPKEMVPKNSPTYKSLTKQGYTIVGSHSGVKICRWTKSALRGRGSCYKYSFYGIASHQCMETTPSLSCSNKCVFCWRHGTNPVGTTWRWKVDQPEDIFDGVKAGHYQKIKMMRGVPGVRAERFAEAMRIRHCALSLVGEPISYPYLNEFTASTFIFFFPLSSAMRPDRAILTTNQCCTRSTSRLFLSVTPSTQISLRL